MLLVCTPQPRGVDGRKLFARVWMALARETGVSIRAHEGPHGEVSSHGWDKQDLEVCSTHPTTFWLKTSSSRILNLNVDFRIVTKVRIEHISFNSLSVG